LAADEEEEEEWKEGKMKDWTEDIVEGEGGGGSCSTSIRRPLEIQFEELNDELAREEEDVGWGAAPRLESSEEDSWEDDQGDEEAIDDVASLPLDLANEPASLLELDLLPSILPSPENEVSPDGLKAIRPDWEVAHPSCSS